MSRRTPRPTGARRPRVLAGTTAATAAAVLLVLFALTGCGITVDAEPRQLEATSTTTTTVAGPSSGKIESVLYYVNEGTLVPAITELPDSRLETVLSALLMTTPPELALDGTLSSIPAGTELLGIARGDHDLTINLSAAFDNVVGLSRQQAIGQMVLTATDRTAFDAIQFQIEGEAIRVSSPLRGDSSTVNACDFAPLLATPDDAASARLPPESVDTLDRRRDKLDEAC